MYDDEDIEGLDEETESEDGKDSSSQSLKDKYDEMKSNRDNYKQKKAEEEEKEKEEKEKDKEPNNSQEQNNNQEQKPLENKKDDPDSKAIEDAKNKNNDQLRKGNNDPSGERKNNNLPKNEKPNDGLSNKLSESRKRQQDKFGKSEEDNPIKRGIDKGKKTINEKLGRSNESNKLGNIGSKAKEGAKKGKEKAAKAVKDGAKKLGKVAKEGIKKIWAALPPDWKIIIIAVIAAIILIFFLILIILLVVGEGSSKNLDDYTSGGTCSYNYSAANDETMSFLSNIANPVGEIAYTISSPFGWRTHPIYGNNVFHRGIDITGTVMGKPVYAAQDGEVISISYNHQSAGNWIKIKHDGNYITEYMHLNDIVSGLQVKDKVAKGTIIGHIGSTGDSTGPHLDFRIQKDNTYISPDPFFGISDIGFEHCIDPNKTTNGNCDEDDRLASKVDFKTILNEYKCDSEVAGDFMSFLTQAEGNPGNCTTSDGKEGYTAKNLGDGTVTAGPGVTNYAIESYQNIIINNNATQYFTKLSTGKYVMKNGECVPKNIINEIMTAVLKSSKDQITKESANLGITLQDYQVNMITSLSYNFGPSVITECLNAYKNYSANGYSNQYEGLWSCMKGKVNFGTNAEAGHKSRRKAEFEVFVTGDYNVKIYGRNINDYDNYNSDNVMSRLR